MPGAKCSLPSAVAYAGQGGDRQSKAAAGGTTAASGRRWGTEPPTCRQAKPSAQAAPFEPAPAGPAAETGACRAAPPVKPDPGRRASPGAGTGAALEEQSDLEGEWLPGHRCPSMAPRGAASLSPWPCRHGTHNTVSWAPGGSRVRCRMFPGFGKLLLRPTRLPAQRAGGAPVSTSEWAESAASRGTRR